LLNKISFILLLVSFCGFAQEKDGVVAAVGSYEITESEFQERFDFSFHPGLLQKGNRDSVKFEFLKQLIAEKLLSMEARSKGYDTLSALRDILTPLENMYARDKLYQLEIKSKVSVTPEEISTGLQRIKKILVLNFIYSKNPEELQFIYNELLSGASFDSLLSLRKELADQPKEITFGTMDKEIEDSVYQLKTGQFTGPLASRDGYYLLKLSGTRNNLQNKSTETIVEDVRRIVSARKEFTQYLRYYRNFFAHHKITADRQIFDSMIPKFLKNFQRKYIHPDTTAKRILFGNEVTLASEDLSDELKNKTFIKINGSRIKINYFLNQLSHEGFSVTEINEGSIRSSLSAFIRKFIEDELLTQEAEKRGLDRHEDVRKYMSMWSDSYMSKMLMLDIYDSLMTANKEFSDEGYYSEQVNIVEILTDSLSIMEKVINELSRGKNIKDLARKYSIRDSLRSKGGEYGFFPITKYGEIGKIAAQMNIGDIYGPIRLQEGYSIFQLIDRKVDSTSADNPMPELKEEYLMRQVLNKFENHMNIYNARLAQKYGVKINEDILKNINNVFLNLVVVRYMGFGGQIFAVPYTEQFSGWYEVWKHTDSDPKP